MSCVTQTTVHEWDSVILVNAPTLARPRTSAVECARKLLSSRMG